MNRRTHRRSWQVKVARVLLIMQVNVLVIAALHHHGYINNLFQRQMTMAASTTPAGSSGERVFCLTCQIVRQGAARPALAAPALRPDSPVLVPKFSIPLSFPTVERTIAQGRAPPPVQS